jgi:hypothetical protein
MEAGYHHNPMVLHLEEYGIRKTPHSRTATTPVGDRELQRMFCECLHRGFDRQRETIPQPRRMLSYQARASSKSHSPQVSRRPEASRFLKQARPDLLPWDDIGRVLLLSSNAVIKLRSLRVRQ